MKDSVIFCQDQKYFLEIYVSKNNIIYDKCPAIYILIVRKYLYHRAKVLVE